MTFRFGLRLGKSSGTLHEVKKRLSEGMVSFLQGRNSIDKSPIENYLSHSS